MKIISTSFFFIIPVAASLILVSISVSAQQNTPDNKKESKITATTVRDSLAKMGQLIIAGYPDKKNSESTVIAQSILKNYETTLKSYYEYPEIEKLTFCSREWYGKLFKIVQEMGKCSAEMNVAIIRLQTDKIPTLNKKYEDLQKLYKEISEKPEKPKSSK